RTIWCFLLFLKRVFVSDVSSTVLCSDGISECPEESSCCEGADGEFGCCPMTRAVCCSDHYHCCPAGFTCDLAHLRCVNSFDATPVMTLQKAVAVKSQESAPEEGEKSESEEEEDDKEEDDEEGRVHCSNQHACPRNSTCCRLGHRRWGCCPLPKAVCCTDHQHCCPAGYQCDLAQQMCVCTAVPKATAVTAPGAVFSLCMCRC
uniref:Granulins domain-containing protein n=1 Tax=Periophthalmus magnuspinnatus TaxID=409849 RepID=A0A3B4A2M0_9GOBI